MMIRWSSEDFVLVRGYNSTGFFHSGDGPYRQYDDVDIPGIGGRILAIWYIRALIAVIYLSLKLTEI